MAVNLDAPFHLCRLASRDMRAQGWGRIVSHVVDVGRGRLGRDRRLRGLEARRARADECVAVRRRHVRRHVQRRAPRLGAHRDGRPLGHRRGGAARITLADVWAERDALYPRGHALDPGEIAEVIAFLCSEAASGVNGEPITVAAGAIW